MLLQGNAAGVAMDPAMATIAPQLQLAQALSQQGLSTAPAYPMQALGRLAQTLAGVKIMHDATGELQGVYGNAADAASRALPDEHPLQKALKSQDPYARMIALQQFPKAMLLMSQPEKMGAGEGKYIGGTTPLAANLGPVSEPGKVTRDVALNPMIPRVAPAMAGLKAGQEALAKAPYEAGGDVTVDTARGRETIPATAATRAAIQPRMAPPTAGPGADAGSTAPLAPHVVQTVPVTRADIGGAPVKTPQYAGEVKGREEIYGGASKAMGTIIGEAIEGGGRATRDKLNALDTMESAVHSAGPNMITGPHAEFALKAKEALAGVGLNADWINKGLPETEIVSKMNAQLASASAKAMTGRPTQAEFTIWMRNNPGLVTSKQGTLALIDVLRQQSKQDLDLSKLAQDKANWDNWPTVADKYFQEHGLINPITHKPMREEIAAARGGQADAGGSAGNPNNTPAKAVPEVGQVVRGHKFLGGDPHNEASWEAVKGAQ
jgi:hypothetical protein